MCPQRSAVTSVMRWTRHMTAQPHSTAAPAGEPFRLCPRNGPAFSVHFRARPLAFSHCDQTSPFSSRPRHRQRTQRAPARVTTTSTAGFAARMERTRALCLCRDRQQPAHLIRRSIHLAVSTQWSSGVSAILLHCSVAAYQMRLCVTPRPFAVCCMPFALTTQSRSSSNRVLTRAIQLQRKYRCIKHFSCDWQVC